jgi:hypothetical protein
MCLRRIASPLLLGLLFFHPQAFGGPTRMATQLPGSDGFVLFAMPTTADPPGTIFRIDQDHKRFIVTDLSGVIPVHRARVEIPEFTNTQQTKVGFLVSILQQFGVLEGPTIETNLGVTRALSVRVDSAVHEFTRDDEVERAIRQRLEKLRRRQGSQYYIVRETINARRAAFTFSRDFVSDVGGSAKIAAAANAKAGVEWKTENGYVLNARFAVPHRVFYKAERLVLPAGGLGGVGDFQRVPVTEPLEWTETTEEAAPSR